MRNDLPSGTYIDYPLINQGGPYTINKPYYVESLGKGMTVGVHTKIHVANLWKAFKTHNLRHYLNMRLHIRQALANLWLLIPAKVTDPKPKTQIVADIRIFGRYKRYAELLKLGQMVPVNSRKEAAKTRAAWMYYTPKDQRLGRTPHITKKEKIFAVVLRTEATREGAKKRQPIQRPR